MSAAGIAPAQPVFTKSLSRREENKLMRCLRENASKPTHWRDYHLMRFLRYSGLRVTAAVLITREQAQDAVATHYLPLTLAQAKGANAYTPYINSRARAALNSLLKLGTQMFWDCSDEGPLLLARTGEGLSVRTVQHSFKKWRELAGLSLNVTPHWMRHTCAYRILEANADSGDAIGLAQKQLGHKNRQTTMIYLKPTREAFEHGIERAGR